MKFELDLSQSNYELLWTDIDQSEFHIAYLSADLFPLTKFDGSFVSGFGSETSGRTDGHILLFYALRSNNVQKLAVSKCSLHSGQ